MNRSVRDIDGSALVVSNFTLCADCRHGRRPEFLSAARSERAEPLYRRFVEQLRINGCGRWKPAALARICGYPWKETAR